MIRQRTDALPNYQRTQWNKRCLGAVLFVALIAASFCNPIRARSEEARGKGTGGQVSPAEKIADAIKTLIDEKVPLYEQAPFDLVILDAANDHAVLKVSPLALPDRKLPQPLPKTGFLELELFDEPGERYRVSWRNVAEIRLFEALLIERATRLIRDKRFGEAYDYLDHVWQFYPKAPGLAEAQQLFLFEEASAALEARKYDRAYANLLNLHQLNPEYPGLADKLTAAADGLIQSYIETSDYPSARGVVDSLAQVVPQHPLVQRWRAVWLQQAEEVRTQIGTCLANGDVRQADRLLRQIGQIWPALSGLADLARRVQQAYPRVRVGVTLPPVAFDPNSLTDWAARRSGRLLFRSLLEYTAPGGEGGIYQSQIVNWKIEELERRLVFQLRADRPAFHSLGYHYSIYDLSQQLLNAADPQRPEFDPEWAAIVSRVRITSPDSVVVELQHLHLRPEGILRRIPLTAWRLTGQETGDPPENGPFTRSQQESDAKTTVYLRASASGTPSPELAEIEEIVFSRGKDGIRALKQGDIDVLDRVNPWELHLLEKEPAIVTQAYRLPLVHMLIPNFSRALPANRDFRRALLYATDRQKILKALVNYRDLPGCRVISGPLPAGRGFDDPVGYGYDSQIEPRPYQPSLGLALAELAFRQSVEFAKKRGMPVPQQRSLTVVHPPHEIAREACLQIRQQWRLIGWETTLVEIHPGKDPLPADCDFVYVEAAIWDPITDLPRSFAPLRENEFFFTQVDSLLRVLGQAVDWPDASSRLATLHRRIYEDTTVLPLWQLTDYYAFRKGIEGLESQRVTLYQNVESWRISKGSK
ncbi:MAG: ABC transporter substrate-binding protein [Thermogutta sp.]